MHRMFSITFDDLCSSLNWNGKYSGSHPFGDGGILAPESQSTSPSADLRRLAKSDFVTGEYSGRSVMASYSTGPLLGHVSCLVAGDCDQPDDFLTGICTSSSAD